jgi:hypothetical protein
MPAKPLRNRLIPYKLLILMLYGDHHFVSRTGLSVILYLGPLSRHLRISSSRLRDQIDWLLTNRYLSSVAMSRGVAIVDLRLPAGLSPAGGSSPEPKE